MDSKSGFSLLELLIAISIISILIAISMPSFLVLHGDKEAELLLQTIQRHISLARSTANANGIVVTLCPSNNGTQCQGTWTQGSILFLDRNANREVDLDDRILRVRANDIQQGKLQWRAFGNRQYLQINAMGFLRHQSGNFTYCDAAGDPASARQLVVNAVGRVRLAIDSNGDGIRENSRGAPIRCP